MVVKTMMSMNSVRYGASGPRKSQAPGPVPRPVTNSEYENCDNGCDHKVREGRCSFN